MDKQNGLTLCAHIPSFRVEEIAYFVRVDDTDICKENFVQVVQFGTVHGSYVNGLLRTMHTLYSPTFFENKEWPDSILSKIRKKYDFFFCPPPLPPTPTLIKLCTLVVLTRLLPLLFHRTLLHSVGWFLSFIAKSSGVRNDFSSHLHKFMAHLTDAQHKPSGHTVLYVPDEGPKMDDQEAMFDKELVQRLEGEISSCGSRILRGEGA